MTQFSATRQRQQASPSTRRLRISLRRLLKTDPWVTLAILMLLTNDQWTRLRNGQVFNDLEKELQAMAQAALSKYPLDSKELAGDLAHNILLKLRKGRFFKRYQARPEGPWAYVLGCAYQTARSEARSIWKRQRRTQGGDALNCL